MYTDPKTKIILIYCLSSVSGGAVSYIRNISPLLSALFRNSSEGHKLKFLAHEDQRDLLQSIDESQIIWIKGNRPTGYGRMLWEYQNIDQIVRKENIDVLFTPYQIGPQMHGPKYVLMLRNMEPFLCGEYSYTPISRLRNYLLKQFSSRTLQQADRIIAVSEFARDHLTKSLKIERERIRMIHHGRNEKLIPDGNTETDRDILSRLGVRDNYILTCGSLLPYRRCEDVIAAFNQCAEDTLHARTQLLIAGAGTDRRYGRLIHRAIAASPYGDRILALGHVPWETMTALYRRCVLCVIATEIEACPNIAIEAMSAGCVIVSSDRPPLPEIFQGASLEYPARNIKHLANQMQQGIIDENLRREMKVRAIQRAEAFSWEKCARETYSALTNW